MDPDLNIIDLSPEDAAELAQPCGPKDAMEAFKIGFAMGISQMGLTPSEFEDIAKQAAISFPIGLGGIPEAIGNAYGTVALGSIGAGAALGAYSGYGRARVEQILDGNGTPEALALKRKIKAYRSMTEDLRRTNSLRNPTPQIA